MYNQISQINTNKPAIKKMIAGLFVLQEKHF